MKQWKQVKIPSRIHLLKKDARGYPIPYSITIDGQGRPDFRTHDPRKLNKCMNRRLCTICGLELKTDIWFTSGPIPVFHPNGAQIDPPVHQECGQYAMQVCPYLIVSAYTKVNSAYVDPAQISGKPPFFVLAKTSGYSIYLPNPNTQYLIPIRPFLEIEFWKEGKRITQEEAEELLR